MPWERHHRRGRLALAMSGDADRRISLCPGSESEAASPGLGDLLLMPICSGDDYLLPHVEQMTCASLSATGGQIHVGKPSPRLCERGEKRGGDDFGHHGPSSQT